MKFKILIIVALLLSTFAKAQNNGIVAYSNEELQWADSVLNTLTTRQKIAQLIMLSVYSNKNEKYNQETIEQFKNLQLGGIIFMQGGPMRQALLCNRIQTELNIPALVSIDAEHGLAMRLDSTLYYPRAMALGAINDTKKIQEMGVEIGRQCRRLGIHVNFAPVLDVNVEPKNPIINIRSFGEDKNRVVECATAYATGLQMSRVLAVGKHFPGHGDTHVDSHLALPLVDHDIKRLNDIEIYPFRKTADIMGGMLVAHLAVPALEPDIKLPSTLSKRIVDSLLINKLGYKGLIFTDALNMRGVADAYQPGELEVRAFIAGNDILLFPSNPELAINKIEQAIADGKITIDELNNRCLKVLRTKAWVGLNHYQPIDTKNLIADLNTAAATDLQIELHNLSLTMIKNDNIIPVKDLANNKILSIAIGSKPRNQFQTTAMQYGKIDTLWLPAKVSNAAINKTVAKARNYNTVIIAMLGTNDVQSKNFGLIPESVKLIDTLAAGNNVILAHLGNPYALSKLRNYKKLKAVFVGYKASNEMQKPAAQTIFGGLEASGHLPVSVSKDIQRGAGKKPKKVIRLDYNEKTINEKKEYDKIDSLVNQSIKDHVMPGCQLLFGHNGKIVYNK
ncbi:MAG: glycoside hydrolase family 3 C-terminal domain-containing protein, partial [Salinivirgaceae bacterium]|nr:glycoside hydrolase family 3 C-terminal domain-containing protein [Salinivirgaceae bacterium]